MIDLGGVALNDETGELFRDGERCGKLTARQTAVVAALSRGRPLSYDNIFSFLYDHLPDCPGPQVVKVFVCQIRKVLRQFSAQADIRTIRQFGYVLEGATVT